MKLIHFFAKKEFGDLGQPAPIKNFLPQWWKDGEADLSSGEPGMKKCIPFLDVMLSGYTLVTPFDIFVSKKDNGQIHISWNSGHPLANFIGQRSEELGKTIPRPAGHLDTHFAFSGFWGMKTPKGYSLLVTHPFNRYDLPFTTLSAFMDSDEFYAPGNIPFFLKEGFTGVIPAGTPFAQLIPIKRDNWKMIPNNQGLVDYNQINSIVRKNGKSYKKLMWHRKEYN
jgi:hypothetical protein